MQWSEIKIHNGNNVCPVDRNCKVRFSRFDPVGKLASDALWAGVLAYQVVEPPVECYVNLYPSGLGPSVYRNFYEAKDDLATGGKTLLMREVGE